MRLSYSGLPRVLIIDDQFGRCSLGKSFQKQVGAELMEAYKADRENLCRIYGILDGSGDSTSLPVETCQVAGVFCPGQKWDADSKSIENDSDSVWSAINRGWPFKDGSRWACVLLDLRFVHGPLNEFGDPQIGDAFGLDVLLPTIREKYGDDLPVIVLSSTPRDQNNSAVRAAGALEFIQRVPGMGAKPDEGRAALQKALFTHGLLEDAERIVVGQSLATLKMLRQARRGAMAARNILLLGETGTGKGLLANYIHRMSARAKCPFEAFHAAHRPADLQADELFGHWRGAFTGADRDAAGIWERINGGTLFIDEVADIDLRVQQMLMQPIEERNVRRIGTPPKDTAEFRSVDALVVLATNRDLNSAAAIGEFKSDFLNRINAFTITVPPLRERMEDLPLLIRQLTSGIAPNWKGKLLGEALVTMSNRDWKDGNIRELRNVIERALANNPDQDITAVDVALPDENRQSLIPVDNSSNRSPSVALTDVIGRDVTQLSLAEIENIKKRYAGAFPNLVADILAYALRLTQANCKSNPTAAVRFLLGNPNLTTVQAKQFLKRLLSLDTQSKSVARAFAKTGLSSEHQLLDKLLAEVIEQKSLGVENGTQSHNDNSAHGS